MPSPAEPQAVLDDLWSRLQSAARDAKHPWHWPAVANVAADGSPSVRTIVLREVDRAARTITFFTDLRSPKVAMLRADPRLAFCFNDGPASMQLRVAAVASVMTGGPTVETCWQTVPPPTRAAYAHPGVPGSPIAEWAAKRPSEGDAGRENFALAVCTVSEIDWLQLHPEGHRRMLFSFASDGSVKAQWLAP